MNYVTQNIHCWCKHEKKADVMKYNTCLPDINEIKIHYMKYMRSKVFSKVHTFTLSKCVNLK